MPPCLTCSVVAAAVCQVLAQPRCNTLYTLTAQCTLVTQAQLGRHYEPDLPSSLSSDRSMRMIRSRLRLRCSTGRCMPAYML